MVTFYNPNFNKEAFPLVSDFPRQWGHRLLDPTVCLVHLKHADMSLPALVFPWFFISKSSFNTVSVSRPLYILMLCFIFHTSCSSLPYVFFGRIVLRGPEISERSSAHNLTALIFMGNTTNGYRTMEVCMWLSVTLKDSLYINWSEFHKSFSTIKSLG